jgi:hypothetical protein
MVRFVVKYIGIVAIFPIAIGGFSSVTKVIHDFAILYFWKRADTNERKR